VVEHHARQYGRSKYGVGRFLRGYLDLLTVLMITRYQHRPGHLFGGVGTAVSLLGGAILVYLTGLKLFTGADIGTRPLLLLGVMLVIIGVQLLLFGLLAELLNSRTQATGTAPLVRDRTDPVRETTAERRDNAAE
jgi:dolichol-phosphate mannosyltransferase